MQTFLTHESFVQSALSLDWRRLGKQRVEAYQISRALVEPDYGWKNHPAVRMWRGFEDALAVYTNCMILEWSRRGFKNTMKLSLDGEFDQSRVQVPSWIGNEMLHSSHRSNLLRKDPVYYGSFGWKEDASLPYFWPV